MSKTRKITVKKTKEFEVGFFKKKLIFLSGLGILGAAGAVLYKLRSVFFKIWQGIYYVLATDFGFLLLGGINFLFFNWFKMKHDKYNSKTDIFFSELLAFVITTLPFFLFYASSWLACEEVYLPCSNSVLAACLGCVAVVANIVLYANYNEQMNG
ncbi:MAG: hypothetical protein WC755_07010 [Candidatus Woesearchaeota archaeon]|jgi:hypothetical protein